MKAPNDKQERIMQHWKFKRRSRKIPLRIVAMFGGYSLQYLKSIESSQQAISDSVVAAYKKTIEIMDKHTKKSVEYEKLSDR